MSEITFREEDHTYHYRGRRVPSVTELLQPVTNYRDDYGAMELGSAVHDATALDDYDDLDATTVPEEVWSYLKAWRSFRRDHVPVGWNGIELTVHNKELGYAGTLDRCGMVSWPRNVQPDFTIIDIKTGHMRPWYELQLYAYALAQGTPLADVRAGVVLLFSDGVFAFHRIDLTKPSLRVNLLALRQVWSLKQEYHLA